jgi:hypothetical protein
MERKRYEGDVVFVSGVHYPVGEDGHADLARPLRRADDGWRSAGDEEPLHNDVNHQSDLEFEVGGES